jgi:hypothetical protein
VEKEALLHYSLQHCLEEISSGIGDGAIAVLIMQEK